MSALETNKVHNMDWVEGAYLLPAKSVNLIIADPPYFEVKGAFDFIWDSFDDYLKDAEKWAKACKHLLADNGSLFVYGHAKKIAYVQVIFDRLFNLENNLVWDKGSFMGLEKSEGLRSFAPCTERILMYSNEVIRTGLEEIKLDINNFKPLRDYFEYLQKSLALPKKAFLDKVGQAADHPFRWGSTQWDMPTEKTYDQLIEAFRIDLLDGFRTYEDLRREYEDLRREYEDLRREYEDLRRPFRNEFSLREVFTFSNEAGKTGAKYDHDTVKPETLTRALILTCSKKGDLVLVPFAGSGTECAMAAKEGREFIGFDVVEKYCKMANDRTAVFLNNRQISILDAIATSNQTQAVL
jgi:site-specific DNA-methyltransferase (adenine-specific)